MSFIKFIDKDNELTESTKVKLEIMSKIIAMLGSSELTELKRILKILERKEEANQASQSNQSN
jgi:hypothetical protein